MINVIKLQCDGQGPSLLCMNEVLGQLGEIGEIEQEGTNVKVYLLVIIVILPFTRFFTRFLPDILPGLADGCQQGFFYTVLTFCRCSAWQPAKTKSTRSPSARVGCLTGEQKRNQPE